MKNPLRLMTIFMATIGGCAAFLVVYILAVYPNLNRNVATKNNEISSAVTAPEDISIDHKQAENSFPSEYNEATNPPLETESDIEPTKSGIYNIDDIEFWFSDSVRNDITGNWRIASIASSEDITDYVIDYYNTLFRSNDEIHAIVNFSLNTTSSISVLYDGMLDVSIHEYIDGEEHDAKILFGGMLLKEYWINTETGEIEDISASSTTPPIEQSEPNVIYSYEVPVENSNQIADNSVSTENESNYNITESQVLTPVGDMVWLSATGEKYHKVNNCGQMNPDKARSVSLEYAISAGYGKCDKCF